MDDVDDFLTGDLCGRVIAVLERGVPANSSSGETLPPRRFGAAQGAGTDRRNAGPDFSGDGAAPAAFEPVAARSSAFSTAAASPLKKAFELRNGSEQMWPSRADVGCESKASLIPPGWSTTRAQRADPRGRSVPLATWEAIIRALAAFADRRNAALVCKAPRSLLQRSKKSD
jgi:hypothetical protein